jgi:hypothetical protein
MRGVYPLFGAASRDAAPAPDSSTADEAMLDDLERASFGYFLHEVNPVNGLIADRTRVG